MYAQDRYGTPQGLQKPGTTTFNTISAQSPAAGYQFLLNAVKSQHAGAPGRGLQSKLSDMVNWPGKLNKERFLTNQGQLPASPQFLRELRELLGANAPHVRNVPQKYDQLSRWEHAKRVMGGGKLPIERSARPTPYMGEA